MAWVVVVLMATVTTCDGCHKPLEGEPLVRGIAVKREYCAACATKCDTFEEAENVLRKSCVERFTLDRQLLINVFTEGGFRLPDVN